MFVGPTGTYTRRPELFLSYIIQWYYIHIYLYIGGVKVSETNDTKILQMSERNDE